MNLLEHAQHDITSVSALLSAAKMLPEFKHMDKKDLLKKDPMDVIKKLEAAKLPNLEKSIRKFRRIFLLN